MDRTITNVKYFLESNGLEFNTIYSSGVAIERVEAYEVTATKYRLRCTVKVTPLFLEFAVYLPAESGPQALEFVNTLNSISLGTIYTIDNQIVFKYSLINMISELNYTDISDGFGLMLTDSETIISSILE
ncbi:hypothetical protein EII38_00820 [Streptococcus minor]|uniref:Uncharacterized protein n=1 Tax=Streptococcus minor TaxID=229549 RepID=A0A3P1VF39_9STRE|nr:hypothetical protein [Streptococcus minor]RRD32307.1 hypothetical protein EII38_00820 [Streptococcus minor]